MVPNRNRHISTNAIIQEQIGAVKRSTSRAIGETGKSKLLDTSVPNIQETSLNLKI